MVKLACARSSGVAWSYMLAFVSVDWHVTFSLPVIAVCPCFPGTAQPALPSASKKDRPKRPPAADQTSSKSKPVWIAWPDTLPRQEDKSTCGKGGDHSAQRLFCVVTRVTTIPSRFWLYL